MRQQTYQATPRLRRAAFQIAGETITGVEFTGRNGLYFWVPDADQMYQWHGYATWVQIEIGSLGTKRRRELLQIWGEPHQTVCP
jgi:hypothetical protein